MRKCNNDFLLTVLLFSLYIYIYIFFSLSLHIIIFFLPSHISSIYLSKKLYSFIFLGSYFGFLWKVKTEMGSSNVSLFYLPHTLLLSLSNYQALIISSRKREEGEESIKTFVL